MADVYLLVRTWHRKTQSAHDAGEGEESIRSNHIGDIIDVRTASQFALSPYSVTERTQFFCFKVTGVPVKALEKLIKPQMAFDAHDEEFILRPRRFSLCGPNISQAKNYIVNNFGAGVVAHLQAYFNDDTELPIDEIKSMTWANFRAKVWNKVSGLAATVDDLET